MCTNKTTKKISKQLKKYMCTYFLPVPSKLFNGSLYLKKTQIIYGCFQFHHLIPEYFSSYLCCHFLLASAILSDFFYSRKFFLSLIFAYVILFVQKVSLRYSSIIIFPEKLLRTLSWSPSSFPSQCSNCHRVFTSVIAIMILHCNLEFICLGECLLLLMISSF